MEIYDKWHFVLFPALKWSFQNPFYNSLTCNGQETNNTLSSSVGVTSKWNGQTKKLGLSAGQVSVLFVQEFLDAVQHVMGPFGFWATCKRLLIEPCPLPHQLVHLLPWWSWGDDLAIIYHSLSKGWQGAGTDPSCHWAGTSCFEEAGGDQNKSPETETRTFWLRMCHLAVLRLGSNESLLTLAQSQMDRLLRFQQFLKKKPHRLPNGQKLKPQFCQTSKIKNKRETSLVLVVSGDSVALYCPKDVVQSSISQCW